MKISDKQCNNWEKMLVKEYLRGISVERGAAQWAVVGGCGQHPVR